MYLQSLSVLLFICKRYKKPIENTNKCDFDINDTTGKNTLKTPDFLVTKNHDSHVLVYDLKSYDDSKDFSSSSLIVVRGKPKLVQNLPWQELRKLTKSQTKEAICEVLVIPRSCHGPYYLLNRLNTSLHFSLGIKGKEMLSEHLSMYDIPIYTIDGMDYDCTSKQKGLPPGIFVKTAIPR